MFQRVLDWISLRKALVAVPVALLALGLVFIPSQGNAQEEGEPDGADGDSGFTIEQCQELRAEVFPRVENILSEIVDSGIVDQEQADGLFGFVDGLADTGCAAQAILQPQDAVAAIADLTGTSESEVKEGIHESGSLSEFASEHGVTEDELVDAILGRAQANADELVESGEIDQDTADKAMALIEMLVSNGVHMDFNGGFELSSDGFNLQDFELPEGSFEWPDGRWQMSGR